MTTIDYSAIDRDGMTKIIALAKTMCRLVQTFETIIRNKFPDSQPILLLLEAILALCPLISDAETAAISYGGDNEIPSDTPSEIAGINPSLPPAPDPVG